jgi:hypothetical protein
MQALTGLERLDLFTDFSNDILSREVMDGIAGLTNLTRLRLKGTGMGTLGVNALADAVRRGSFSKLVQLRVETVGVNVTAVQVFFSLDIL